MSGFKVGDRVEVIGVNKSDPLIGNEYIKDGMFGTIIVIENSEPNIGVEFDDYIKGHNAYGKGKKGYCWFMYTDKLKKVEKENIQMSKFKVSKFKVGDRVKAIYEGKLGTVRTIEGIPPNIGVEFDDKVVGGHSLQGLGKKGHCWFMTEEGIKKIGSNTDEEAEVKEVEDTEAEENNTAENEVERLCLTIEKAMNRLYEIADTYTRKQAANGIINTFQRQAVNRLELDGFKKVLEEKNHEDM